jgi:hypothetical protein
LSTSLVTTLPKVSIGKTTIPVNKITGIGQAQQNPSYNSGVAIGNLTVSNPLLGPIPGPIVSLGGSASGVGTVNQTASPTTQAANPGTSYGLVLNTGDYGVVTPTVTAANSAVPGAVAVPTSSTPATSTNVLSSLIPSGVSPIVLLIAFVAILLLLK